MGPRHRAQRAPSPARSEAEVDIAGALFEGSDAGDEQQNAIPESGDFDFDGFLNAGDDGADDDGGDEAFIALQQAASFRKSWNLKGKTVKKGGGFQAMGLNANLLRAITRKGFSVPTPIQRKAIPLVLDKRDVVGMARTGSGKTAAFVIPMIERLRAHSARVGARALVLSPSRELALQTLKVVKEFGKGTDLKGVLLVGGDSLEEQFAAMATNPDIIIATPGRFLHLKVEMHMDLSSIRYVVFDEADRLFEMGFATQLTEILHALPTNRQTLLFSATLPSSLVEFARAGLQDPSLVRLDAESKVSPDLQSAFFTVKGGEKEGALLHILHDVIKMPTGLPEGVTEQYDEKPSLKRKRDGDRSGREKPTEHSTIIFAATKHHVEFLANLLIHAGFAVSYVYGALDQTARKIQVENFRRGRSNILVVTDVAARGIDIPVLANVINYDFPPQPKIFVHRVGRTARAGQKGWSYSLVRDSDAPYLLDLQLFLGRKLVVGREEAGAAPRFADEVIVGALQRTEVEPNVDWVNRVLEDSEDIAMLRRVAVKAEKLYVKTRHSASAASAKRAREMVGTASWSQLHPLFGEEQADKEDARARMLATISGFKPQETIFEVGDQGKAKGAKNAAAEAVRGFRTRVAPRRITAQEQEMRRDKYAKYGQEKDGEGESGEEEEGEDGQGEFEDEDEVVVDEEEELEVTVSGSANTSKKGQTSFEDPSVFMSYTPRTLNAAEEKGYGVHSGSQVNFVTAAREVAMDMTNDEGATAFGVPTRAKMRWDKKNSKYVSRDNDEDGSKGAKMVRGESGVKIAASFNSGRFDRWRKANKLGQMPHVGEFEKSGLARQASGPGGGPGSGPRYKHKKVQEPKDADKFRDDYHVRKKRVAEAKEQRIGKFRDGAGSAKEIKSAGDIQKERRIAAMKREKNARPEKKRGRVKKKA
ncbi:DEAD-domain-containing protein [Coniochaeta ligniaria NRRL 30616]|uniref:RNA helicase n=1 Tax=Coniochaeta ligniaria NRRL 30616 TaxID=1408157 RepID=A0A1J7IXM4_9PEZI|nr:DEAD-domain-containing protein [Coniochaeta ligniaria NRRL 30616]